MSDFGAGVLSYDEKKLKSPIYLEETELIQRNEFRFFQKIIRLAIFGYYNIVYAI